MRWLEHGRHGAMDYMQRHGRRRARPAGTGPGHAARHLARAWTTCRRTRATPDDVLADRDARLRVALRARPRLSQGAAPAARSGSPSASSAQRRRVRLSRVRRQRARAREGVRAQRRARLDRQAHEPDQSARRLVVLSRRDPHRPAAAAPISRRAITAAVPRLHRRVPDAGDRRALRARRDAAASPISRSSCAARFPIEFRKAIGNRIYGCDDCQLVCPWNKFARIDRRSGLRSAPRARRREPDGAVRVERERSSSSAPKAAPSAASATSAGCGTSRSRSATRRRATKSSRRSSRGATIRQRWCASTWQWALRSMASRSGAGLQLAACDLARCRSGARGRCARRSGPRSSRRLARWRILQRRRIPNRKSSPA